MKWYSRKSDEICSNIDLTPSSLPPACFFKLSQWELWKIEKSEFLLLQTFIRCRQYWLRLTFNLEKWSLQHKRSITSICLDAFKGSLFGEMSFYINKTLNLTLTLWYFHIGARFIEKWTQAEQKGSVTIVRNVRSKAIM